MNEAAVIINYSFVGFGACNSFLSGLNGILPVGTGDLAACDCGG